MTYEYKEDLWKALTNRKQLRGANRRHKLTTTDDTVTIDRDMELGGSLVITMENIHLHFAFNEDRKLCALKQIMVPV